jgi:uncharacterized RDD family membrane protein YckC
MLNTDQYTLETPENIEVEFELAGLGSRFCAMLIDTLLICFILFLLFLLALILGFSMESTRFGRVGGGHELSDWLLAIIMVVAGVLFTSGYFIFFEFIMSGQTPGKKSMKIRVIRDDGTPVTGNEILVRNILRLADFLPFGYALGAIVMFPNPLCKRLGDLAAGTIVVKEGQLNYRANADDKIQLGPVVLSTANNELTIEESRLLMGFMQRRSELLPKARWELAERLARPLLEKYGGHYVDAESYLERLVEGRHYES